MYKKLTIKSKIRDYDVEFLTSINELPSFDSKSIFVIDSNIIKLFPEFVKYNPIIIESTEFNKTLLGVNYLLNEFSNKKANRYTNIVAIGGGVLQDIVGFSCSIFCRGIDYIFIPTTLLSQVDSCIGGKTSINFENKKNILGTFYPPSKILICEEFLKTLPKLDIINGLGEVYKFHILQNKIDKFCLKENLLDEVYSSLEYKKNILELDEFDRKERLFLNFGHTFGHAIETTSNHEIPHGIAVIFGCMIAVRISSMLNYDINFEDIIYSTGIDLIKKTNISLKKEWFDIETLLNVAKSDKKYNGNFRMILMSYEPLLDNITNLDIIIDAINKTYESI